MPIAFLNPFFKVDGVSRKDQNDFTEAFSNALLLK